MGELHYFLEIQVTRIDDSGLLMTQSKYVKDLLVKAGMNGCKYCSTPLSLSLNIQAIGGAELDNPHLYRLVVKNLQYLTVTRLDLTFSVNKLAQFMQALLESHWKLVKRILCYVSGAATYGHKLSKDPSMKITTYCNPDWACDPSDRKSIGGFCVYVGRNLVSWHSKKQGVVARSSTKAEYRALADLVAELIWIKGLIEELKWPVQEAPMAYCDNQRTMFLAENPILHLKTKHFEIDLHFVRDYVTSKVIQVSHVPNSVQIVDTFTKALPSTAFLHLRDKLKVQNLENSAPLSLRGHDRGYNKDM
ncbi:uncharacterized protein LOC107620791 [Arachis ipaensis]|uniref:uncharacterized protein LOC107620791 n=1 Tax=Arachis ipaensis TaxID=130454 RepID=UPI0007AEEA78|nr:uncharacterized protein LOC107620791 [Arachis ipaensis]XP_025685256.1 uncharacterized protein LOC112786046 [Arachis hypogaea]